MSPLGQKLSIIISARNESRTIAGVIGQARLVRPQSEIIVVCNGSIDRTARRARKAGATKVIVSKAFLGHNVGRSLGAKYAGGDILLFMDADYVIPSTLLEVYVRKVEEGWGVVLNKYSGEGPKRPDSVSKYFLNHLLRRPDLEGNSMTTVPYALSRQAMNVIGVEQLCVPPVAQAIAILNGLPVISCGYIDTSKGKNMRPEQLKKMTRLMMGDHAEAISYLVMRNGARAGFTDFGRDREALIFAERGGE